jgi:anti-sigma B factor antagonist
MNLAMNTSPDGAHLTLSGEMTIYSALELKKLLLDACRNHKALEVDLSQVAEFDTAGLQLLVLMQQHARADGTTLRIVNCSTAIADALHLCGLDPMFT